MSYILDALKKLEQKRQKGAVPDITTVHLDGRSRTAKRRLWPVLIAAALVLNAVVLALVFAPWKGGNRAMVAQAVPEEETPEREMTALQQQRPVIDTARLPAATAGERTAAVTAPFVQTPAPDTKPARAQTAPEVSSVPEHTPVSAPADDAEMPEDTAAPLQAEPAEPLASARLDLSVQELDDLKKTLEEERMIPETETPGEPLPSASEQEQGAPGDRTVELSELPSDIKSGLPELTISGHIYSNSPQSRLVNINGNLLREGEKVSPDLSVEEITLSGVIFTYRGYRFLVRAF